MKKIILCGIAICGIMANSYANNVEKKGEVKTEVKEANTNLEDEVVSDCYYSIMVYDEKLNFVEMVLDIVPTDTATDCLLLAWTRAEQLALKHPSFTLQIESKYPW